MIIEGPKEAFCSWLLHAVDAPPDLGDTGIAGADVLTPLVALAAEAGYDGAACDGAGKESGAAAGVAEAPPDFGAVPSIILPKQIKVFPRYWLDLIPFGILQREDTSLSTASIMDGSISIIMGVIFSMTTGAMDEISDPINPENMSGLAA